MMPRINLLLTIVVFLVMACNTSKELSKPMAEYEDRFEDRISIMNIPVRINVKELEKSLNAQLEGILYEDGDLNDGDNMMVKASKKEDISLEVDSQLVKYRVPLSLWIKYDAGLTNLEAQGEIALSFKTAFQIREDWKMETITELQGHEWLKKPKLKMGAISLPVGFIADIVLRNSQTTITKSIDEMVKENLKLDEIVEEAWTKMFDPILVSEEYNTWLQVNPENLTMTPLNVEDNFISSTIIVESRPSIKLGEIPTNAEKKPLPPFQYALEKEKDFVLHLSTEIPYKEAERLAKQNMIGETFESKNKSVTVEDLELYGQGNKLIVNTKLSGSYNGSVYFEGKPEYNDRRNSIDIKDIKFTLETRNFLLRSAAWLLRSTMKKRIQENMDFLLDYNLKEIEGQLQEQLQNYPLTEQIFLNGNLDELNIQNAYLAPEAIRVEVALKGQVNVQVNGLN